MTEDTMGEWRGPARRALEAHEVDRRQVLKCAAGVAAGIAGLGIFGGAGAMPVLGQAHSAGIAFAPSGDQAADAAGAENQVYRVASDPTVAKVLDFYEMVYGRPGIADLFSDPLVRIDKNFQIQPGAALEWSGSADGKTWTFKLDPNLVWSDGNPVTANDWVKTFQYSADPKHAWDFTWFWLPDIKGYAEAVNGKAPLDQIGVRQGANPHELIFDTLVAAPYLPAKLLYSLPLSAAALAKSGPLYNTKPETAVSSGPFILSEWLRDQSITYKRNASYKGSLKVPFQTVIVKMAAPNTLFTLYQAGEIDEMEGPAPGELKLAEADPEMSKQIYQGVGDFGCFYFFFDVTKAPFNNLKVRQAFSHVLDRDAVQKQILGLQGKPAYSFLAPGFPAANGDALKGIQNFDPTLGKKLLADAGYPDGKGFPKLTLQERGGGTPIEDATVQAYASMLKKYLNIDVQVSVQERKSFYADLNAKPTKILFGWVSYGMDYLDPSNMLGVWLSGGRHSWSNAQYDKTVKEATSFLGDPAQRTTMFQSAEKILVEDVPAVFAWFTTPIQLIKPYVKGDALVADKNKIAAIHWPGYTTMDTVPAGLYISKDAPANRK